MLLPPQRSRVEQVPDPVPDPEPASPSLPMPDPGVFHPEPEPFDLPDPSLERLAAEPLDERSSLFNSRLK